jgi:hypothetical protein
MGGRKSSLAERLAHEVSILFGVGHQFGWQPGAKVFDDDHTRATARAWPGQHLRPVQGNVGLLLGVRGRRGDVEESAGHCDALGAIG